MPRSVSVQFCHFGRAFGFAFLAYGLVIIQPGCTQNDHGSNDDQDTESSGGQVEAGRSLGGSELPGVGGGVSVTPGSGGVASSGGASVDGGAPSSGGSPSNGGAVGEMGGLPSQEGGAVGEMGGLPSQEGGAVGEMGGRPGSGGVASMGGAGDAGAPGACIPPVPELTVLHPGNYDYEPCAQCHSGSNAYWGGWLYNNALGDAFVGEATVTIKNSDGTTVSAPTEREGLFSFSGGIGAEFIPCVSKCPDTICATQPHTSPSCQDPSCHGSETTRIYLPQSQVPSGVGGAGGTDCTQPVSGGARVHSAREYDNNYQSCRICHDEHYTGGYVYDGITSSNVVPMATVTITPVDGEPIVVATGPGGMFFLGDVGSPSTTIQLKAPYTACVSKCPSTICSAPNTHTTTDNCSECHNDTLRIYIK